MISEQPYVTHGKKKRKGKRMVDERKNVKIIVHPWCGGM
jgi:hypothetical protein